MILLIAPCASSVRMAENFDAISAEDNLRAFEHLVEAGAKAEAEMKCADLSATMRSLTLETDHVLESLFNITDDPGEEVEGRAMQTAEAIMAVAAAADKRHCLVPVMEPAQVHIEEALSTHLTSVLSGSSIYGEESLDRAYNRLIAWQAGMEDHAGPDLERKVLFLDDIESDCPAPCAKCSKKHNSWSKGEELFKFKCLLKNKGDKPPAEEGLTCTAPRSRRSFWRFHTLAYKSWCTVSQWQKAACNQLRVTTLMSCGTNLILQPLMHHWNASTAMESAYVTFFDCVRWETTLQSFHSMHYRYGHAGHRVSVPKKNQLGFRLILGLGLANGLAALRDKSSPEPQNLTKSFLSIFEQGHQPDDNLIQIFNGSANAGGRLNSDGDKSIMEGDILRSCPDLVADIDRCRPAWKSRMENWPAHAWRFAYALGSMAQYAALFAGMVFFGNAAGFVALGLATSGSWSSAFTATAVLYLQILTTTFTFFGAFTGYEAWHLKDHGYIPKCDVVNKPRARQSWTQLLEDAKKYANKVEHH